MRIAVVVVNFNYGRYIFGALDSIMRQSRPADEIVVVDDGSSDDSLHVLRQFGDRITVIEQSNGGVARATNVAVEATSSDVVAFLDADDLMLKDRLRSLEMAYLDNPRAAWVWHELKPVDRATAGAVEMAAITVDESDRREMWFDVRRDAQVGRTNIGLPAPATSGLSFRTEFLRSMLPMPHLVRSQDGYLKFAAAGLTSGVFVQRVLGLQGLHDANSFSTASGRSRDRFRAENAIAMASGWASHPELVRMADRFVGDAIGLSIVGVGMSTQYRALLMQYIRRVALRRKMRIAKAALIALGRGRVEALRAVPS